MDTDYEERARRRKERMVGGIATSFEELEAASAAFWARASYEERLRATHAAIWEAWIIGGKRGPAPRFDGSTWGVLRFER